MSIMNLDSLLESVVVTVDVTTDVKGMFDLLCGHNSRLVRLTYNLAIKKADGCVVLLPQMGGGIELRITSIGNSAAFKGCTAPFGKKAIYIGGEVQSDFVPDHGKAVLDGLDILHKGDAIMLALSLSGTYCYLLEAADHGFYDQLAEIELATSQSATSDVAEEEPNLVNPSGNPTFVPVPNPVTYESPVVVASPTDSDEIESSLDTGSAESAMDNNADDDGPVLDVE